MTTDEFTFADIADCQGRSGCWISVHADNAHVGISADMMEELDAEDGHAFVLAFDAQSRPWVGVLPHARHGCPSINAKSSAHVYSTSLAVKLRRWTKDGQRTRFYWTGETRMARTDERLAVNLYRVTPGGAAHA